VVLAGWFLCGYDLAARVQPAPGESLEVCVRVGDGLAVSAAVGDAEGVEVRLAPGARVGCTGPAPR
jgi:hypothetical protein